MKIEGHLNIIEQEVKSLRVRLKNSVEVVRCKDCKYYDFWESRGVHLCGRWAGDPYEAAEPGEEDFCSHGERRE